MNWIFPFERTQFSINHKVQDVQYLLSPLIDHTNLFDTEKEHRQKPNSSNEIIKLKSNLGFFYKTQHYEIRISAVNDSTTVNIFSRNNFLMIIIYTLSFVIGLVGFVLKVINIDFIALLFLLLWIGIMSFISNILFKIIRISIIKKIKDLLC
jgi:hypothetical protein